MLLIIAPSKTQKIEGPCPEQYTLPAFLPEIRALVRQLKILDREELAALMGMSANLADLTWKRYQEFAASFTPANARPAIFAFQGGVYGGIQAGDFSQEDLQFAQEHLRIISGLYGLLKPLDLVQPYRLEMKTKITTQDASDLYGFWGGKITGLVNRDMEADGTANLVNLASQEYFKAILPAQLKAPVLDIVFKVRKNGQYKVVAIHAKRARGLMVHFVIKNRLEDIQDLKKFREEGYRYNESLSRELHWVFCKE